MKAEKYRKEENLKVKKIWKIRNNAEKCEYLSYLELDEGRKVQKREENVKPKVNKLKKKRNSPKKCENLA